MISKEILQKHYEEYASQPDSWVENMEVVKKRIVSTVLQHVDFNTLKKNTKIVVLGTSDKRYIKIHKRIFSDLLKKPIKLTTFDIDIEHLSGEDGIVYHDVTQSFSNQSYDIIFSHELMKFLTSDEQLQTIINSYNSLAKNGLAMHILHEPSIKGTSELRKWQYRVDPEKLIEKLKANNIYPEKIVFNVETDIGWLHETTVIYIRK